MLDAATRTTQVTLGEQEVTPATVAAVAHQRTGVDASPRVRERLQAARSVIDDVIAANVPAYGVNRGVGPARNQAIPEDLLTDYQGFILGSHDAAMGPPLPAADARAIVFARLAVMARAGSGVCPSTFDALLDLLRHDVVPAIPEVGSVGSADLAQLAAVGEVLRGRGDVLGPGGALVPAAAALAAAGLRPVQLHAKDGLAIVGANAATLGRAALVHERLVNALAVADLVAAATIEALGANPSAFSALAVDALPHPGQVSSARRLRVALEGGDLASGVLGVMSVQDSLSVRTVPQVHGALADHLALMRQYLVIELNSPSENPYIDVPTASIVSNGNFSVVGLAIAIEAVRIAIAHVALTTERRIAALVERIRSTDPLVVQIREFRATGAPPPAPVILSNTASALTARIRHAANPVSLLGTTVGDGVEDHNSQAYEAVRLTVDATDSLTELQAIEALLASMVLRRQPPRTLGAVVSRLVEELAPIAARSTDTRVSTVLEDIRARLNRPARDREAT